MHYLLLTAWEANYTTLLCVFIAIVTIFAGLVIFFSYQYSPDKYDPIIKAKSPCLKDVYLGKDDFKVVFTTIRQQNRTFAVEGADGIYIPDRFVEQNKKLEIITAEIANKIISYRVTDMQNTREILQEELDKFSMNLEKVYQVSADQNDKVISDAERCILHKRIYQENEIILGRVNNLLEATRKHILEHNLILRS